MDFGFLGPLEVRHNGELVAVTGEKRKAILAILLMNANSVVPADQLIQDLWGDTPPASGAKALQMRVSQLRKALATASDDDVIAAREPGYMIELEPHQLDLHRFERLADFARGGLAGGDAARASEQLSEALALWRGPALADFRYENFAQLAITRLEELRVAGQELRVEADLRLGRHEQLVGELGALVGEYPLRERLRAQLMLALYRSGRQSEALEAYRVARESFVESLGIEPGPSLQELEKAILQQDPALELGGAAIGQKEAPTTPRRAVLVASSRESELTALLAIAVPLTRGSGRELVVTNLVESRDELADVAARLHDRRNDLVRDGVPARVAAFRSSDPGADTAKLAAEQDVDLALLDATSELIESGELTEGLLTVLNHAPCDVGVCAIDGRKSKVSPDRPVVVPFGGAEHDWGAVELGGWIARANDAKLVLLGAGDVQGDDDASRLLARASLIVQKGTGIPAEPRLVTRGAEPLLESVADAGLVVVGLSSRRALGELGGVRLALLREAPVPTILVRKGVRPGGLAPPESLTRFGWSLSLRV